MEAYVMSGNGTLSEMISKIEGYESFIWTERYSAAGDFQLDLPCTRENLDIYKEDRWLYMPGNTTAMIIDSVTTTTDHEEGDRIEVKGFSLESLLERRIIWGQQSIAGNLQAGVRQLLNTNATTSAPSAPRRIPILIAADTNTDPSITGLTWETQYTGTNLYEAITNICDANELGFRIYTTTPGGNQCRFTLYNGVDRSHSQSTNPYVTFSPTFDNLLTSEYVSHNRNLKTITLVGGEGEGSARRYYSASQPGYGSSTGMDRRELFVDARDLSSETDDGVLTNTQYENALEVRGLEKLTEFTKTVEFTGEVDAQQLYRFGEHFFMGDILQMENEYGQGARVRVTEFTRISDNTGETAYPTFKVL